MIINIQATNIYGHLRNHDCFFFHLCEWGKVRQFPISWVVADDVKCSVWLPSGASRLYLIFYIWAMPPLEGDSVMPHPVSSLLLISGLHDGDIDDKKIYEGLGYWCESHCMLCKSYCTLTKYGECGFRLLLLPMMMMVMGVWVLFQFRDFLGADLCRTCSFRYFQVIFKQKIFSASTHVM